MAAARNDAARASVVGTPGRIDEHLRKGSLTLDSLTMLVLDEADRMLDMGFQATIDDIIADTPADRQTLLFSATFPDEQSSGGQSLAPVAEAGIADIFLLTKLRR